MNSSWNLKRSEIQKLKEMVECGDPRYEFYVKDKDTNKLHLIKSIEFKGDHLKETDTAYINSEYFVKFVHITCNQDDYVKNDMSDLNEMDIVVVKKPTVLLSEILFK